jgi:hypothetical protein
LPEEVLEIVVELSRTTGLRRKSSVCLCFSGNADEDELCAMPADPETLRNPNALQSQSLASATSA